MSNEYEYTLETALDKLEDSLLTWQEIEVIRLACGKPRNEQVHPLLRDVINDFSRVFGDPLASFPSMWSKK